MDNLDKQIERIMPMVDAWVAQEEAKAEAKELQLYAVRSKRIDDLIAGR